VEYCSTWYFPVMCSDRSTILLYLLEVVVGRSRADDGWTLVQAKTRHAMMVNNGNPDSMIGSEKKFNSMKANVLR
jgi:hypothetical protein